CEPGILPLLRHGEHVFRVKMPPGRVASALAPGRRRVAVTPQPILHDVVVELLRPEHASMRLPRDRLPLSRGTGRQHRSVEGVGLRAALVEDLLGIGAQIARRRILH
ncbi:MAG: hypothetical protein ACK56I_05675, partial [bacterium]